jgi:hypothetical protein
MAASIVSYIKIACAVHGQACSHAQSAGQRALRIGTSGESFFIHSAPIRDIKISLHVRYYGGWSGQSTHDYRWQCGVEDDLPGIAGTIDIARRKRCS